MWVYVNGNTERFLNSLNYKRIQSTTSYSHPRPGAVGPFHPDQYTTLHFLSFSFTYSLTHPLIPSLILFIALANLLLSIFSKNTLTLTTANSKINGHSVQKIV